MSFAILQVLIIGFFPWLSKRISQNSRLGGVLSPVVLCYALGIVLGNLPSIPLDLQLAESLTEITIILAIPLLLFSTNLKLWIQQARSVLLSFALCVLSGLIATISTAVLFRNTADDVWQIAGMLVGIYTGGTPNMQAIGLALQAEQETIVLLNAADIFCGGLLFIFLLSLASRFYGLFLPPYPKDKIQSEEAIVADKQALHWRPVLYGLGLSAGVAGLSLGVAYLFFGDLSKTALIMLLLTSFSILASLSPRIRNWRGTYESGDYLLLMFCVALGMQANFSSLIDKGGQLALFTGAALSATFIIHLLFARWLKIDRDTAMITFTAAAYGPAFVGQIASTINNKGLIFAGIAAGLFGYAIGNYLGIGTAYFLRWVF